MSTEGVARDCNSTHAQNYTEMKTSLGKGDDLSKVTQLGKAEEDLEAGPLLTLKALLLPLY